MATTASDLSEIEAARVAAIQALQAFADGGLRVAEAMDTLLRVDPAADAGGTDRSDNVLIEQYMSQVNESVHGMLLIVASMWGRERIAVLFADQVDGERDG